MVIDTFEMQRQYLTSSMTIFNLIIQVIANKGQEEESISILKSNSFFFLFS
jgi:hypothetical protein